MTNVSAADYLLQANADRDGVFMPLTTRFDRNLTRFSVRSTFADLIDHPSAPRPVNVAPAGRGDV